MSYFICNIAFYMLTFHRPFQFFVRLWIPGSVHVAIIRRLDTHSRTRSHGLCILYKNMPCPPNAASSCPPNSNYTYTPGHWLRVSGVFGGKGGGWGHEFVCRAWILQMEWVGKGFMYLTKKQSVLGGFEWSVRRVCVRNMCGILIHLVR